MPLVARPLATRSRVPANCLAGDGVGAAACVAGPPVSGIYQVTTADISTLAKVPAVGVIVAKPTATSCLVQLGGEVRGVYGGLVPGATYFVSATGAPTTAPPAPTLLNPRVYVQILGVALAADVLWLAVDNSMIVRVL